MAKPHHGKVSPTDTLEVFRRLHDRSLSESYEGKSPEARRRAEARRKIEERQLDKELGEL